MRLVLLVLATIFTVFFLVHLGRGKKYAYLVENLDAKEYPLKDLYIVGFSCADTKLLALKGEVKNNLYKNSKLYWDNDYSEYYAVLTWAQFLSLSLVALSIGSVFASLIGNEGGLLIFGIAVLAVMAIWNLTMSKMKEAVEKRRDECLSEFPNMISKLSLLIGSGMQLREAWFLVARGKEGPLYDLMRRACDWMNNGASDVAAIHRFGVLSDSIEIKKFTSAVVQGIEKGNEVSSLLLSQSAELWAHKRQLALQNGEVAAGKLIIPLGLTFGGIILIIVAAAMQSMTF